MKILVGMPSKDSWGGPISSEPPFVDALRASGADVVEEVYVFGDKGRPTPLFERIRRVVGTAVRFRKLLGNRQFDVIHLNTAFDLKTILRDTFSIFVMRPGRAKVFLKLHGSEADRFADANFFVRLIIAYLRRHVDGFGVHTREELDSFKRIGFDEAKFSFVKNAITVHQDLGPDFSRTQKDRDARFKLLFVSRFIPAKGLLETISATAIVLGRGFEVDLIAIGDGETMEEARDLAQRLGIAEHVEFTGYIPESEVADRFFAADILVFPTRHAEGFPNVLFKAVAVGLPVVTTRVRAAADYLAEPVNCLFSTQEPKSVADRIVELIEDRALRENMSAANLELGRSLLPARVAREFLAIYARL